MPYFGAIMGTCTSTTNNCTLAWDSSTSTKDISDKYYWTIQYDPLTIREAEEDKELGWWDGGEIE